MAADRVRQAVEAFTARRTPARSGRINVRGIAAVKATNKARTLVRQLAKVIPVATTTSPQPENNSTATATNLKGACSINSTSCAGAHTDTSNMEVSMPGDGVKLTTSTSSMEVRMPGDGIKLTTSATSSRADARTSTSTMEVPMPNRGITFSKSPTGIGDCGDLTDLLGYDGVDGIDGEVTNTKAAETVAEGARGEGAKEKVRSSEHSFGASGSGEAPAVPGNYRAHLMRHAAACATRQANALPGPVGTNKMGARSKFTLRRTKMVQSMPPPYLGRTRPSIKETETVASGIVVTEELLDQAREKLPPATKRYLDRCRLQHVMAKTAGHSDRRHNKSHPSPEPVSVLRKPDALDPPVGYYPWASSEVVAAATVTNPRESMTNPHSEFFCMIEVAGGKLVPLNVLVDGGATFSFVNTSRVDVFSWFPVGVKPASLILTGATQSGRRVRAAQLPMVSIRSANPTDTPCISVRDAYAMPSALPHDMVIGTDSIYRNQIRWICPKDTDLPAGTPVPPCSITFDADPGGGCWTKFVGDRDVSQIVASLQAEFDVADFDDYAEEIAALPLLARCEARRVPVTEAALEEEFGRTTLSADGRDSHEPVWVPPDPVGTSVGTRRDVHQEVVPPPDPVGPPSAPDWVALPTSTGVVTQRPRGPEAVGRHLHPDMDGRLRECELSDTKVTFKGGRSMTVVPADVVPFDPLLTGLLLAEVRSPDAMPRLQWAAGGPVPAPAVTLAAMHGIPDHSATVLPDSALPSNIQHKEDMQLLLQPYLDASVSSDGQLPHMEDPKCSSKGAGCSAST